MQNTSALRILSTNDIIRQTRTAPLHLMSCPDDMPVSSKSRWRDEVWDLDGYGSTRLIWSFTLPDGSLFTAPQYSRLMDSFKRLQWSLFADPRAGKRMSTSSCGSTGIGLRTLAKWMAHNNYADFSQLEPESIELFTKDLINQKIVEVNELDDTILEEAEKIDEDDDFGQDGDAVHSASEDAEVEPAANAFHAIRQSYTYWKRVYVQRGALAEAGIPVIAFDPLNGKSVLASAKAVAQEIVKAIPPLPDEVALPIMAEAHRWLGVRADDVMRLQEMYLSLLASKDKPPSNRSTDVIRRADAAYLNEFEFSVEPGGTEPWHPPVKCIPDSVRKFRYVVPTAVVRGLVDTVAQAGAIVLQSETGMRASELISIPAGYDDAQRQYNALNRKLSISGLNELFFIRSHLIKTVDTPVKEEWIAGARPIGSEFTPGPCRAVQVVDRLLAPWRARADDLENQGKLFVTLGLGKALPIWNKSIAAWNGATALRAFKDFVSTKVDLSHLPDKSKLGEDLTTYRDSKGMCVRTHQWRKTWAMYVVRTDRRMIPAIAMQFKHLSIAMTESSYIGTDAGLMRERDSQQARAAAAFMYQAITGRAKVAGRMAKMIDEWLDELKGVVGEKSGVAAINDLQEWCEVRGIKVYSSPHGKCFIRLAPTDAKCHEASATTHWSRKAPNYGSREPDTCNGCKCFGVDSDHADFWISRYMDYTRSFDAFKADGLKAGFRIIQERAAQSANMLRALGIDPSTLKGDIHA